MQEDLAPPFPAKGPGSGAGHALTQSERPLLAVRHRSSPVAHGNSAGPSLVAATDARAAN